MHMHIFSEINKARCESPSGFNHKIESWSTSDWMTATLGELGEAANIVKKLNRVRDGIPGNKSTELELRANLADELADTFIYLDLLAQSLGICLEMAVMEKFERTSQKVGYQRLGKDNHGQYREPYAYEHIDRDGRIAPDRDSL